MVFKRLLGSLGVGGPTVDTVLDPGAARPGGTLSGRVHLVGGTADHHVEHVALELVARVETEHREHDGGSGGEGDEGEGVVVFDRHTVGGAFRLAAGEETSLPFTVTLPWETPVTELYGQPLGIVLGVRTELAVAGARDRGDLDPLAVAPLPAQEAVLEALGGLGFGFRSADLEYGRIGGTGQRLPFYQEIELTPPPRYAHQVDEIELTFLAVPGALEVVLEADKRGGPFSDGHDGHGGHDALSRFTVPHEGPAGPHDWSALVDGWVQELVEHRASYGSHAVYGHESGVGAAVLAGAAGIAGGMVAAEVVDEVGDFFEGDSDDGEG
ncbi:sporulation-control protein [Streptomyces tendae]|uniref:sporulation protein n=1 Tax=Streptomyces tendae TaxID=1932 RepID=UPI0038358C3D